MWAHRGDTRDGSVYRAECDGLDSASHLGLQKEPRTASHVLEGHPSGS